MRELTVRIRFVTPALGNVKDAATGRFLLPRSPRGAVVFMATWHRQNLQFAARTVGRHQSEVGRIGWDVEVDGVVARDSWHRIYYTAGRRTRYVLYESFTVGQEVGLHCVVPDAVGDDDLAALLTVAGRYRGLSPHRPGEYGRFEVAAVGPRGGPDVERPGGVATPRRVVSSPASSSELECEGGAAQRKPNVTT